MNNLRLDSFFSKRRQLCMSRHAAASRSLLADVPRVVKHCFGAGSEFDLDEPITRYHAVPCDLWVPPPPPTKPHVGNREGYLVMVVAYG